jgi:hypothetical protein
MAITAKGGQSDISKALPIVRRKLFYSHSGHRKEVYAN